MDKKIQNAELPLIRQIIEDEKWLLGEIRGSGISENDPDLREKVVEVILRYGAEMRIMASGKLDLDI